MIHAYVLWDDEGITGLICASCKRDDDLNVTPIYAEGGTICDRCGATA